MTTGKTIALTRRTLVGKVMSLLLNMLSRLVITFLPRSKHLLIRSHVIRLLARLGNRSSGMRKDLPKFDAGDLQAVKTESRSLMISCDSSSPTLEPWLCGISLTLFHC